MSERRLSREQLDDADVLAAFMIGNIPGVLRALYSPEEQRQVIEMCRRPSGRVSAEAVAEVIATDIRAVSTNYLGLLSALARHEGALRAALQAEYGIRLLARGRTEPNRTPLELADLVEHLPSGSALGRDIGGIAAVSQESELLREVEYGIRALAYVQGGGRGQEPKRLDLPPSPDEERAERERIDRKAREHQARAERRAARRAARAGTDN